MFCSDVRVRERQNEQKQGVGDSDVIGDFLMIIAQTTIFDGHQYLH